jgi:hypothetical protein
LFNGTGVGVPNFHRPKQGRHTRSQLRSTRANWNLGIFVRSIAERTHFLKSIPSYNCDAAFASSPRTGHEVFKVRAERIVVLDYHYLGTRRRAFRGSEKPFHLVMRRSCPPCKLRPDMNTDLIEAIFSKPPEGAQS